MSATAVARMLGEQVDLLSIDTSTPRPWTPGAKHIMRPGLRSIWFGSRGAGKSIAALIVATQVIEAGGSVVYCDWENGPRRQAERLEAILEDRPPALRPLIGGQLDYRPTVRLGKLDDTTVADWAALFAGRDLAILDSATRALGQLGLDENAAGDFATFMTRYVDPIAEQGTAVLLLDNTGHEEQNRTRGSSAKLDLCELAYKVTSQDIAPDRAGTITLERVRTRDGDEARQLAAHVGDGSYSTVHPPELSERQAAVVEAILSYVEQHPGSTTEEVAKGIGKRASECRSQLADLETPGTGTGTGAECHTPARAGISHRRAKQQPSRSIGRTRTGTAPRLVAVPPSPAL